MLAFWNGFLAVLFIIICCLLVIVVLLQKGRGGGLGAAFGGAGTAAFGTRTGDVFTWITIVLTAMFLLLAIGASFAYRDSSGQLPYVTIRVDSEDGGAKHLALKAGSDKKVKIYYTLDGGEPTEKSAHYAGSLIELRRGQVLKARAFRHNWEPSEIAVHSWETPATASAPASSPAATSSSPAGEVQTAPASGPAGATLPAATQPGR
ncbi:MAG: preprotein translocase subunit SecG [Planctomycetes bacterium]|nr:preprotein translocase subunit SecG [Planctomycetota bacterium]